MDIKPKNSTRWAWLALILIVLGVGAIRFRVLSQPLERDEGEYAYAGQLILEGSPPYSLAYNMKLPGTYYAYAGIMGLFGQTPSGIHFGLLLVNAAAILFVFLIARRLFGQAAGVIAAASFALLSLSPSSVLGLCAHATHFVILPALIAIYLLLRQIPPEIVIVAPIQDDPERSRSSPSAAVLLVIGVLFGTGVIMKQAGAAFGVFAGLWICMAEWRFRESWRKSVLRIGAYSLGTVIPIAVVFAGMAWAGVFQHFWFWTMDYARAYASEISFSDAGGMFARSFPGIAGAAPWMWIAAALGVVQVLACKKTRGSGLFATGFLLASMLAVCPGFYFRRHYFILLLPAVAILVGACFSMMPGWIALVTKRRELQWGLPVLLFLAGCADFFAGQAGYLFSPTPPELVRISYIECPFVEAVPVGEYLRQHASPNARIAVIGSEPEYLYAHRHSATGYIYMYGLVEQQPYAPKMEQEMMQEIEATKPEYLVLVSFASSWSTLSGYSPKILNWGLEYARKNYEIEGIANFLGGNRTDYRWGDAVKDYQPQLLRHSFLLVFKRRPG